VQATVLLLFRDRATGEWRRSGDWQPFNDDPVRSGHEKAAAFGKAWVERDPEHRKYKVSTASIGSPSIEGSGPEKANEFELSATARVVYICQRCAARETVRAALRPPALRTCVKCGGQLKAVRLISGRELHKRLHQRPTGE